jgi:hypothetical protein
LYLKNKDRTHQISRYSSIKLDNSSGTSGLISFLTLELIARRCNPYDLCDKAHPPTTSHPNLQLHQLLQNYLPDQIIPCIGNVDDGTG